MMHEDLLTSVVEAKRKRRQRDLQDLSISAFVGTRRLGLTF